MARHKSLRENKLITYAGVVFKSIDLVDALYLAKVELKEIARILDVDAKAFTKRYEHRLKELETVMSGLVLQRAYKEAITGNNKMMEIFLVKFGFTNPEQAGGKAPLPWQVNIAPRAAERERKRLSELRSDTAKEKVVKPVKKKIAKKKAVHKKVAKKKAAKRKSK